MITEEFTSGVAFGAVLVLVFAVLVLVIFDGRRRPILRRDRLSDGAVLLMRQGRVRAMSEQARAWLGVAPGQDLATTLAPILGEGLGGSADALTALERDGTPFHLALSAEGLGPVELIGLPEGGQLRVTLRQSDPTGLRHGSATSDISWAGDGLAATSVQALLEVAPLILWNRDEHGRINWSSGQIGRGTNAVSAEQAVGMIAARQSLHGVGPSDVERTRLELGAAGSVALHAVEIDGPSGNRVGFAVDASVAATAERTLTRFIQTMTETFAHLTVGLAIFDSNQTLILFNPALSDMWRIDAAWLARRPALREILDRLRGERRIPEQVDYHIWRDTLLTLFDNPEQVHYETDWDLNDGTRIHVMARPHPHGALAFVFDDVTEQVRLENRYRRMDDQLRTAIDRLDEGLAVIGADGLLQFVNSAFHEIWDTDTETVAPGKHAREVFGLCANLTVEAEPWERAEIFATGDINRTPWHARLTLGGGRAIRARFAPLPGGSTLVAFNDISDSERAALALVERNEALETAEEIRRMVLDETSHKLRTPLNTVMGFAQLLTDARFGELNPRQLTYATGISEAAGQILDGVNEVTGLASMAVERPSRESGGIDIDHAIEATRDLLQQRAAAAEVRLLAGRGDPVGRMERDPTRIRQLLFSLAADALQRAVPGSEVSLSGRRNLDGSTAILLLEMPPEGVEITTSRVEDASTLLPQIRRMVGREGGELTLGKAASGNGVEIVCRFAPAMQKKRALITADNLPAAR